MMVLIAAVAAFVFLTPTPTHARYGWVEEYVGPKNWGKWVYLGNRDAKKRIVLFGDSHMHQYMRGILSELGKDYAIDFLSGPCNVGRTQSALNPFFQKDFFEKYCVPMQKTLLQNSTPDVVINGNFLRLYANMPKDAQQLKAQLADKIAAFNPPPKLMIFLGDPGEIHSICETTNVRRLKHKRKTCPQPSQQAHWDFKKWSQESAFPPFVQFVYPYDFYCNAAGTCQVWNDEGKPNYLDQDHLTFDGSLPIVRAIKERIDAL